jgi:hypothetical protein
MSAGEGIVTQIPAGFDVFVSYAHGDDRRFVEKLVEELRRAFAAIAGRRLTVFLDQDGIPTAQRWQQTIRSALRTSSVMVAIITENYLSSDWCALEYEFFVAIEHDHSIKYGSAQSIPRIFPVMPAGQPDEAGLSPEQRRRRLDASERQGIELAGTESPMFTREVARLARDIHEALGRLAEFGAAPSALGVPALAEGDDDDTEHPQVTSGYAKGGDRFISLLAEAVNVTVVGWTNLSLADSLETALELKRARQGSHAFWRSLRIVFLKDDLLELIRDEHDAQFPTKETALRRRRQNAGYGRRSLSALLLKENQPHRFSLHEYGYIPPFTGTLFDMPDGRRIVQIVIRPPRRSASDHLFLEFADRTDQYFGAAFNDIVDLSHKYDEVLPIGEPDDDDVFQCTGARFRNRVLQDGSGATGWLPIVLVVTWWEAKGAAVPLLQLRTSRNSGRELDHLSHPAGHITQEDYRELEEHSERAGRVTFPLPTHAPMIAARRRVALELGADLPQEVTFARNFRYYHHDKEHLFFWVFDCKLPSRFQFPADAEMRPYTVEELLAIRENQVFDHAVRLCRNADVSRQNLERMAWIAAFNLTAHGHGDLASALLERVRGARADLTELQDDLAVRANRTRQFNQTATGERRILGLSGLQYREFFTGILPLYARLGVPGAVEYLDILEADETRMAAVERLAHIYADVNVMTQIPLEI